MPTRDPRSLADALRAFDDDHLASLLQRRADLIRPAPTNIAALAARATTGPSVARCLDGLDALTLTVLHVVAWADPACSAKEAVARAAKGHGRGATTACRKALADLIDLALVWGPPTTLHAVLPVRDLLPTAPSFTWPRPSASSTPIDLPVDRVDALGAVHAREQVGLVRDLLDDWSAQPPTVLRSGALSLRDFAAARAALHADWARTALTIEVAHAARLFAGDGDDPPSWVPTEHYDTWLAQDPAAQWLDLVDAWLNLPRLASRADERTQVLAPDQNRSAVPPLRRAVLDVLATATAGTTVTAAAIQAVLDDREPRRGGELRRQTVDATLREAADLGLLGAGALTTAGRLLVSAPGIADPAARRSVTTALATVTPDDIDHVLVQADLTIIAPGPLAPAAARRLRMVADVESRGHATVYRVSEASIRRALDVGWDAAAIHDLLATLSTTPIPQPLTYLVDDVARRHGAVRVGPALSYVRSDDVDLLARLCADRTLRALGLRRVADTVVICQAPTAEVLTALRRSGLAPAAEGPDGGIVLRRPHERRTPTPRAAPIASRRVDRSRLAAAAVHSMRAGERAGTSAPVAGPATSTAPPAQSAAAVVAALRSALADTRPVLVGYAGTDGVVGATVVDPIRLHAGVLTAFDHRTDAVREFAVSRITAVADA